MKLIKSWWFRGIAIILVASIVASLLSGCVYEPLETDLSTRNVYPITTNTYQVGNATLQYLDGYFQNVYVNGIAVGGGGLETDPIFTASPAFGITALDINAWNDHPALITGTHGVTGTIVGTSDVQSLTNKQLLMNNADAIKWGTFAGVPQDTISLLASNILQVTNPSGAIQVLGGAINLNYAIDEDIYLWGSTTGTGRELVLYGDWATAGVTLRDSPTIDMAASYWDGGAAVGWSGGIIHNMITAGATPKSRLEFGINGVDILRLENDNGTVKTYSDGVLDMTTHQINNVVDPTLAQDAATKNYVDSAVNYYPQGDNSCQLYLPLYDWDLRDSPFDSKDLNAHVCTATGTTWGTLGRLFNGTTDYIAINTVATALNFDGAHTMMGWVALSAWGNGNTLMAAGVTTASNPFSAFDFSSNTFRGITYKVTAGYNIVPSLLTYANDTNWHFLAMTVDADGHINNFIIDGVAQGSNSTNVNSLAGINKFYIGQLPYSSANINPWHGTIGECYVYSGELSTTVIETIRLATKWRYEP